MKRMTVEEFLKLIEKFKPCKSGLHRFKQLDGSLKKRLEQVKELHSGDWCWLRAVAYACPFRDCSLCGENVPEKCQIRTYLKSAGLL